MWIQFLEEETDTSKFKPTRRTEYRIWDPVPALQNSNCETLYDYLHAIKKGSSPRSLVLIVSLRNSPFFPFTDFNEFSGVV